MTDFVVPLAIAVIGLVATGLGAVVGARAAKFGAEKNAEAVRRQVQDQGAVEHGHWMRQERLNTYESFLEAWDECLRIPVIQHHAVGVDLQHIAIDREDLFQGGAGVKNGRVIVEPIEQVQVEGAVRQVEGEESERSAHVDRKMSHQGIMRSYRAILARSFEDAA
ncbi:hypothetical protein ACIRSD_41380 [Streptomyces acidicola]|uniref:hypothetical protein n=1 Tax=Streptomyces acidicola TaxID=2596892 RepID=UPI00382B405F